MIVNTTPSVEGKSITRYHGIFAGEAINDVLLVSAPGHMEVQT